MVRGVAPVTMAAAPVCAGVYTVDVALRPALGLAIRSWFEYKYLFYGAGMSMISWHPTTGAHAVWGPILVRWTQLGQERFGYPITDEQTTPDNLGRYNHFKSPVVTKVFLIGRTKVGMRSREAQTSAHERQMHSSIE